MTLLSVFAYGKSWGCRLETCMPSCPKRGAELTQAALKCIRAQGYSKNPTPVSCEDAVRNLREEINDVLIAAYVLGLVDSSCVKDWSKLVRWAKRLQEANEKKEAENGYKE